VKVEKDESLEEENESLEEELAMLDADSEDDSTVVTIVHGGGVNCCASNVQNEKVTGNWLVFVTNT